MQYGWPDATHEEVLAAARAANMDYAFDGRTSLGGLCWHQGGTAERWAEAALCDRPCKNREPSIVLLDEDTSALNSASEQLVQQGLYAVRKGRTTFTIVHRLSTIRVSDLIMVLSSGQISEQRGP